MTLKGVTAGQRPESTGTEIRGLEALLRANEKAQVSLTDIEGGVHAGALVGLLGGNGGIDGSLLMLKTALSVEVLPTARIRGIEFQELPKTRVEESVWRPCLTLRMAFPEGGKKASARVGVAYVQHGFRWIPSYHVDMDGAGKARVRFQATVVNDLADIENATVNLVIGVPSFLFTGQLDPMSLQASMSGVAAAMSSRPDASSSMSNILSNAIMSQVVTPQGGGGGDTSGTPASPPMDDGKTEDLYLFTLKDITLKRGDRMTVPVADFPADYEDLYRLAVPYSAPLEISQSFQPEQLARLAVASDAASVTHVIRMTNSGTAPFTTAPVLVTQGGRVVAQTLMTYTPAGARCDLELTTAVDIGVKYEEVETARKDRAYYMADVPFARVDLKGIVTLTHRGSKPARVEVVRYVLGRVDSAIDGATVEQLGLASIDHVSTLPEWWNWWRRPNWWHNVNGAGRVTWNTELKAGESREFTYTWHYFWR